jgi:hypothetical protein
MADCPVPAFVPGERNRAVFTCEFIPANRAMVKVSEAPPVQKKYRLALHPACDTYFFF